MFDYESLTFYSFSLALVLFVWFKTDAFVEYSLLFRFKKLFYIADFIDKKQIGGDLTYPDYLVIYRDSFFSRLISCPTCLAVWLGALFFPFHVNPWLVPEVILIGLGIFLVLSSLERTAYE